MINITYSITIFQNYTFIESFIFYYLVIKSQHQINLSFDRQIIFIHFMKN